MATQIKETSIIKQATVTATRNSYTPDQTARPMMMTMRSAVAPVADDGFIRNEYVIIIDQYGHVDEPNIDLGILGDNKVTKLRFEMHHDWNNATSSDYDVKLFIYNKQLPLGSNNPKAITPKSYDIYSATFILENNYFNGGGTYELIYSVIEKDDDNNNISTEREVFISDIITGTLTDVGIPTNFMELITAIEPAGEETFFNYVEKPYLQIDTTNQVAHIKGEVNINKMDAYTTPIIYMTYMPEYFSNWYLVYRTPDNRVGAVEFNTEQAGGRFTWAPKEWGYVAGEVSVWIVSMHAEDDTTYITNKLSFMVKDNFLSAIDLETSIYDSGDSTISSVNDKPIVTNESIGGYHKIKYTGEQLDEWLDYVAALFEEDAMGALSTIDDLPEEIRNLDTKINEVQNDLSNMNAIVECDHACEITGNTGDEHGLAIEDQQMLLNRVQGQSLVPNNIININQTYRDEHRYPIYVGVDDDNTIHYGVHIDSNFPSEPITQIITVFNEPDDLWFDVIKDHIYLLKGAKKTNSSWYDSSCLAVDGGGLALEDYGLGAIGKAGEGGKICLIFVLMNVHPTQAESSTVIYPELIDLTVMFGAGNEPKTVEEYYSRYKGGYIPHSEENSFKHSNCNLISTGRNLLDRTKEIKHKSLDYYTGEAISNQNYSVSDYIPVVSGVSYITSGGTSGNIFWFDKDKNFVKRTGTTGTVSEDNIAFARIHYKLVENEVMFNVETTALPYEPYKEEVISGIGELKAFDYINNAGKKVYATELYTITNDISFGYNVEGNYKSFYIQNTNTNFKYVSTTATYIDKFINTSPYISYVYAQKNGVIIIQTNKNYATKAEFLADMVGVQIMSESATPIEEEINLPAGYAVYKNGYQIQDGEVPYVLTKQYSLSTKAQVLANIEIDREQQRQIAELRNLIQTSITSIQTAMEDEY